MKKFIIIISTLVATQVLAKAKSHREHGSHQHGAGSLGIAFEENKGRLEFKIPSESVIGFEYTPKTDKDKKIKEAQLAKLETGVTEMVAFDASLKCQISKDKIEVVRDEKESKSAHSEHSEHSDLEATFNVICDKSPIGSKVTFNVQKIFPKIRDLDVQLIVGNIQKSIEARKNGVSIELKP